MYLSQSSENFPRSPSICLKSHNAKGICILYASFLTLEFPVGETSLSYFQGAWIRWVAGSRVPVLKWGYMGRGPEEEGVEVEGLPSPFTRSAVGPGKGL